MNIDEMVLALVKTGKFTLPVGLRVPDGKEHKGEIRYWLNTSYFGGSPISDEGAYDLCAMHFARESADQPIWGTRTLARFNGSMGRGDSAAAIAALYEATKGSE